MVNALIERWHLETHTFYILIGERAITLKDVAIILGLSTNGLSMTEVIISSFDALEVKYLYQFGIVPRKIDCRKSFIKLTWLRNMKDCLVLIDEIGMQKYVKCHIMLLFEMILFGDKSKGVGILFRLKGGRWSTLFLTWAWICLSFFALIPDSLDFLR
ncbi:hypothetical protein Ahy_B08g093045 [Arachis hypogaea]|uniref:Aminotransferase-like plant mobile domain-containing protein n=1 Tax=Arachis hypogaea TaxID=3818 RepID=A0A444Y563_ARAHY|nr:hypothetical protein Ahy_B08g093045 [Arachis hypogaea]